MVAWGGVGDLLLKRHEGTYLYGSDYSGVHSCQNWVHIIACKLLDKVDEKRKNNFGVYLRIRQKIRNSQQG